MEKKQDSINWLLEEINKQKAWADPSKLDPIIEKAKAMHREETIKFSYKVLNESNDSFNGYVDEEKIYNETFGGNNE